MRLSDATIRTLALPDKGQKTHWCESLPGFGVRISQGGTRSFVLQHGQDRQLTTIGRYPIISLADARAEAKRLLAERTLGKHRPQSVPFEEAKTLFLAAVKAKNKPRTHYDYSRVLNRHFNFGTRQVADIMPADINRKLDHLTHAPAEQRYALVLSKIFFRWCLRRHYLDHSPCERLQAQTKMQSRDRILTDDELVKVWTVAGERGQFGVIVKLLILTGQRRSEIAGLRKEWICEDKIRLPKEVTKNGREHTFPVGKLGTDIISGHLSPTGYIFPARGLQGNRPFNGWSKSKVALDKLAKIDPWTLHDLRRTFASNLAALGVRLEVIEKLLNHISGSFAGVVSIYQRHNFMPEMRDAVDKWERRLGELLA